MVAPDRCALCGAECESWSLAESPRGWVCIRCRLLALGRKLRRVAALCPGVPWGEVLRLLLPRPGSGWSGQEAARRWEQAAREPVAELATLARAEWAREEQARMANEGGNVLIEEWEEGWLEVLVGEEVVFEGCQWDTLAVLHLLEALGVRAEHRRHAATEPTL